MATVTFPEIGCDTRETLVHFEGIAEETAPVGVRAGTDELGGPVKEDIDVDKLIRGRRGIMSSLSI